MGKKKMSSRCRGRSSVGPWESSSYFLEVLLEFSSLRDRFTDVKLVCGSVCVRSHQALLSLYSPFLKRLFEGEAIRPGKRDPEVLVVLDTKDEDLLPLMELLYSGKPLEYLSPERLKRVESVARMLDLRLPPLESPREIPPPDISPPTACLQCRKSFSDSLLLKDHLDVCQKNGIVSDILKIPRISQESPPMEPAPPPPPPAQPAVIPRKRGRPRKVQGGPGSANPLPSKIPKKKSENPGIAPDASAENGCPYCTNTYTNLNHLKEHFCTHYKDDIWKIIKTLTTNPAVCALCFKEFRKPLIKSVIIRHYGITHMYIRDYIDEEVFEEYFSSSLKGLNRKAALKKRLMHKMNSQSPTLQSDTKVIGPNLPVAVKSSSSSSSSSPSLGVVARKSQGNDDGIFISSGNEIRGFMDNDDNSLVSSNDTFATPHHSSATAEQSIYHPGEIMNDFYPHDSFEGFPPSTNEGNSHMNEGYYANYGAYPLTTTDGNHINPQPISDSYFQSNYDQPEPSLHPQSEGYFSDEMNYYHNNSYYPPPPHPTSANNPPSRSSEG